MDRTHEGRRQHLRLRIYRAFSSAMIALGVSGWAYSTLEPLAVASATKGGFMSYDVSVGKFLLEQEKTWDGPYLWEED